MSLTRTIESGPLPPGTTFQKVELIELTRALTLSQGQRVNIFTESKYAYHILHHHAAVWKERGLLNTKKAIINGPLILRLL